MYSEHTFFFRLPILVVDAVHVAKHYTDVYGSIDTKRDGLVYGSIHNIHGVQMIINFIQQSTVKHRRELAIQNTVVCDGLVSTPMPACESECTLIFRRVKMN